MKIQKKYAFLASLAIGLLAHTTAWGQSGVIYSQAPSTWSLGSVATTFFESPPSYGSVLPASYVEPTVYPSTYAAESIAPRPVQSFSSTPRRISSVGGTGGLAQQKAEQAAQTGHRGHVNNNLGGAKFEGVGWSTSSPQDAIQHCCYWGQRPPVQIGVSKSFDGCWYACVLYQ